MEPGSVAQMASKAAGVIEIRTMSGIWERGARRRESREKPPRRLADDAGA
jgi:hypothetical protein